MKRMLYAVLALMVLVLGAGMPVASAGPVSMLTGSTSATGAAINVSTGWSPRYVVVTNPATTSPVRVEWNSAMASASCLKSVASATSGNGTAGVPLVTRATVSCISPYAGTTSAGKGFTIGADTNLNINGDVLYYEAWQ